MSLEKLLVSHVRIIIFDPKKNMTQITTPSTEYFHFILNLLYYTIHSFTFLMLLSHYQNTALLLYYSYKWNEFDHINCKC